MPPNIPIVDVSPFAPFACECPCPSFALTEDQRTTAKEINLVCRDIGFMYISGHGVDPQLISRTFDALQEFFDLPLEVKKQYSARNSPLFRGFNSIETGAHSCTPEESLEENRRDLKESFTIGAEEHPSLPNSRLHGPNQWPASAVLNNFRDTMEEYWDSVRNVAYAVMAGIAVSLNLPPTFFHERCRNPMAQMVLVQYPPQVSLTDAQKGCGEHTDCGFITFVCQDNVPGLEVQRRNGEWVLAEPIPNTFVCNLGDLLQRWTNDIYKSTLHRVTNQSTTLARHSIPFFINCDHETLVECIVPPKDHEEISIVSKYPPILAGDYMLNRLGLMHSNSERAS